MKPMHVDFAPVTRPSPIAWLACAAFGVGAAACIAWAALASREGLQLDQQLARLQQLQHQVAPIAPTRAPEAPPRYASDAQIAWHEAAFSTADGLRSIESIALVGVTPVSIELAAATGIVRVQVEYSDDASLLNYLSALNDGASSGRWALMQATAARGHKGTAVFQSEW